ncbi:undecaprenyldiphospho-muramoylpentapeptide beta-N-acetylglucosaminyltransferase [Marinobacterium jannaschii]|uniref:undecaprenyldiphospho-muramoylpentapeptide beta-N-acetylglucosaminyltransferase n=1 Tax=Marinobacterium jannaschii TaxID=64970 RepID=UPI00048263D2|nr:undecaprenyldiphospho-muramoylpentapeptide beta-N-acetylglucosaminyltransferase [Marinobacterium jannaschii]
MGDRRVALIMAGGTGGHVFPALATVHELQGNGVHCEWLGTAKGIEAEVVPAAGLKLHCISVSGLRGKGKLGLLLAPFRLLWALVQALKVIRQVKPDVVLGMGGFASGPGGVAAWLLGIPLVIHEQNALAGMTNRLLSRVARRVLEAFDNGFQGKVEAEQVGNPVRGPILQMGEPEQRFGDRQGALRLLVVGGSLGAKALNEALPQYLAALPEEERPEVWHQTGKRTFTETLQSYESLGVTAKVVPFIDDMSEAYGWADLVICRSGALTVSELAIAGVPSLLVPFPHAVDDHQTKNAEYLSSLGAAQLLPQPELNAETLKQIINGRFSSRDALLVMARKAKQLARPEAGKRVAEVCQEVMK